MDKRRVVSSCHMRNLGNIRSTLQSLYLQSLLSIFCVLYVTCGSIEVHCTRRCHPFDLTDFGKFENDRRFLWLVVRVLGDWDTLMRIESGERGIW